MKKLLDYDAHSGMSQVFHSDGNGGFAVQTVQNVAPIIAENKQIKQIQSESWKGDMHHVARIPQALADAWWRELGDNPFHKRNRKWLIAKLNSRDFSGLRTKDGRL
jgi:hypothetical protein